MWRRGTRSHYGDRGGLTSWLMWTSSLPWICCVNKDSGPSVWRQPSHMDHRFCTRRKHDESTESVLANGVSSFTSELQHLPPDQYGYHSLARSVRNRCLQHLGSPSQHAV
ncbi:hypothetical protein J6590_108353 [Homalodisca vitripennis]|nr:hypothetical protein J6590_108353 [Homalodisca vitripennis]